MLGRITWYEQRMVATASGQAGLWLDPVKPGVDGPYNGRTGESVSQEDMFHRNGEPYVRRPIPI